MWASVAEFLCSSTRAIGSPHVRRFHGSPQSVLIKFTAQFRISSPRRARCSSTANGSKSASGKTFPTYNPATGEVMAQVAEGDREDIDRAVKAARKAFESGPWPKMTASERGRADLEAGRLDRSSIWKSSRSWRASTTASRCKVARVADVPLAVDLFRYMAGWATKIEGNTIPISAGRSKFLAYTRREPVGVVGQIIPWNFPLLMAAWKLGPALATGCTVVLKPAEQTPLSALLLAELIARSRIPRRRGQRRAGLW